MFEPWTYFLRLQKSTLDGMVGVNRVMMDGYLRWLCQQQAIFGRSFDCRRAADAHTRPDVVPEGPDLQDHYGRRSHDIDVERDV